ncbi:probable inactive 1-aminocyclopropane-1-carboxylate synthase-like protein 2 [Diadema setosum]|uniref:probable inactive 1-aminocyclopropane-1-carboxylate synthase-like protein 2 n=1 Tax=Diadema setosum TaxID=31175 RepID=UPI003B3BCB04
MVPPYDQCIKHALHAILDEIYLAGIYDHGDRPSSSILSIPEKDIPDLERAHFLWGISKDFAYASSHCSVLYSHNEGVLQGVSMLSDYHTVSSLTQVALTQILGDKEWVHRVYLPAFCRRLQEARDAVTTALDKLGVEYVRPRAGLYVWMNLVKYMGCSTAEEECSLCLHLVSCGLHIHPSSRFYGDEPGWFRMIISAPMPELREALKRLSTGLLSYVPNATSDKP